MEKSSIKCGPMLPSMCTIRYTRQHGLTRIEQISFRVYKSFEMYLEKRENTGMYQHNLIATDSAYYYANIKNCNMILIFFSFTQHNEIEKCQNRRKNLLGTSKRTSGPNGKGGDNGP